MSARDIVCFAPCFLVSKTRFCGNRSPDAICAGRPEIRHRSVVDDRAGFRGSEGRESYQRCTSTYVADGRNKEREGSNGLYW